MKEQVHGFLLLFSAAICLLIAMPTLSQSFPDTSRADKSASLVHFRENLLTVRVKDVLLKNVLSEIAAKAGIVVILRTPIEETVSEEFSNLNLERALTKLTRNYSRVFIYASASENEEAATVRAVMLYPRLAGQLSKEVKTPAPVAGSNQNETKMSKQAPADFLLKSLRHKDPEVREDTVDLLASSKDRRATALLSEVLLNDEDEDVRASAAEGLAELGEKKAIDSLIQALGDNSADVRESAIEALAELGGEEVITPLTAALNDEDEFVRETAQDALDEITSKQRLKPTKDKGRADQ